MASGTITLDATHYIEGYKDGWIAALETMVELAKTSGTGEIDWLAVSKKLPEVVEKFSHMHFSGTVEI